MPFTLGLWSSGYEIRDSLVCTMDDSTLTRVITQSKVLIPGSSPGGPIFKMITEKELKQKYEVLRKKYTLPTFDELNKNFGIILLIDGKKDFVGELLVSIRHKMVDTFQAWVNMLHSMYIPAPNYMPSIKQHEALKEEDNKKIFLIIAKLILLTQRSYKLSLFWENNGKDAEFIKDGYEDFMKLKKDIGHFIDMNIDTWENVLKQ